MWIDTITLPSHWAPFLINGDASGMTDEDMLDLDEWRRRHPRHRVLSMVEGSERFTWSGKVYGSRYHGCDVADFDVDTEGYGQ